MNYIAQKDAMGCGVACVANRLGISYDKALALFEYPKYAKTIGYKCKYIVQALQNAGIGTRLKHIRRDLPLPDLPVGTIVFLERSEAYPYQHYLLKVKDGWCDPWINMHQDTDVKLAKAGVRSELPGRAYYAIGEFTA